MSDEFRFTYDFGIVDVFGVDRAVVVVTPDTLTLGVEGAAKPIWGTDTPEDDIYQNILADILGEGGLPYPERRRLLYEITRLFDPTSPYALPMEKNNG